MRADPTRQTITEAARRAQIVAGAIATVNQIGYHRASLAEIAERAGVAKSAIVYYFGSKDALLLHVLDEVFGRLGVEVAAAVARSVGPVARLRAYAETYLDHVDAHRHAVAAAVHIVVSHRGADGVPLYLTGSPDDSALLRAILREGIEQGLFRAIPLEDAVRLAENTIDLAITTVQRDPESELDTLKPETVEFLFRGLGVGG